MKVTRKQRSVLPVYLVGAVWLIGVVFFSVHQVTGYVQLALISALVYLIAYALFPNKMIEVEIPDPKPVEKMPKDPELAALQKERDRAVEELQRLNVNITDERISQQLDHIQATTEKIFAFVMEHPEKKGQIRRFQDYYLPTTIKLLNAYDRMDQLGVSGANIDLSKQKVEQMLTTVEIAYDKQLDALFQDEAMDISADVTVLERMMAQEGLTDSGQQL
jgi:hypothetical protein